MKEFGGYLAIDSGTNTFYKEEMFDGLVCLNSARFAILFVTLVKCFDKIWIPYYLCKSVWSVLTANNVDVGFYSIDDKFEPILEGCKDNEVVLVVNYFGIKTADFYRTCCQRYKNVIFDNTQAFYAPPILEVGKYNVYSPRKFVGVADGAYLISNDMVLKEKAVELGIDKSHNRSGHLLAAIEEGTNSFYKNSLYAEADIEQSGILKMSALTKTLLSLYDYDKMRRKRILNFNIMCNAFQLTNELNIEKVSEKNVPMIYPLLTNKGAEVRSRLVEKRIYCPQWWKWILDEIPDEINNTEKYFANNIIPVPIDQRYSEADMHILAISINEELEFCKNSILKK